ncbi:DUF3509 domain-containing protein [Pseudomonas borbori]
MQLRTDLVANAFPEYAVSAAPRPDGSILLTLSKDDKPRHSRAVAVNSMLTQEAVQDVIAQLHWGIKAAEDNADWADNYQSMARSNLPTYSGTPVYFRALQTLVSRRILKHAS